MPYFGWLAYLYSAPATKLFTKQNKIYLKKEVSYLNKLILGKSNRGSTIFVKLRNGA